MVGIDERIRTFYHLIQLGEVDKAAQIVNQFDIDQESNHDSLKVSLARQRLYIEVGDYDQTLEEAVITERKAREEGNKILQFHALTHIVHSYLALAQYQQAQETINRAENAWNRISEREKNQVDPLLADLENFKGLIAQNNGDLDSAMKHYRKSLTIREKYDLQRDIGLTYFNIGSNYQAMKDMSKAIDNYNRALEIFKKVKYYKGLSVIYNTLKLYYQSIGDANQAFEYEQQMRVLDEKIDVDYRLLSSAKEISRLSNELSIANKTIIDLEQKLWSLQFQLDSSGTEEGISANQIVSLQDEVENLREKTMEIADLLTLEQEKNDILEQEKSNLEDQILKLEEELRKRENEHAKIIESSKKITELNEALAAEKQKVLTLETELANLKQITKQKEEQTKHEDTQRTEEEINRELANLKTSYEEKMNELKKQMEIKELNLTSEIKDLKQKLEKKELDMETLELKVKNSESAQKIERRDVLIEQELKKQEELVRIHEKRIEELEAMNLQLKKEIETKNNISKEKPTRVIPVQQYISSTVKSSKLEDLIDTSKLAQQIHEILKVERKVPLRFLSMRIGVSSDRCMEEIKKFEALGAIRLEYANGNESNPTIILK